MAKEFFQHSQTRQLFKTLETISQRSGVSRGMTFEDVLRASVAALAAETMEGEYFDAIQKHTEGKPGKRGVDLFPIFFGQTVEAMSRTDDDVLGDLFQGAISYGENGLYLTPQPVAQLMARLNTSSADKSAEDQPTVVSDPCCGTGILLIEAGRANPQAELVGQDVDPRCVRITAINLGLRQKFGWAICGNTLTRDVQFVYRIGSFFHEGPNGLRRGVIREVLPEECPVLPELRQTVRRDLFDSVDANSPADQPSPPQQTIMEIPRYVLQVEQCLAAGGQPSQEADVAEESPAEKEPERPDDQPPKSQGELF